MRTIEQGKVIIMKKLIFVIGDIETNVTLIPCILEKDYRVLTMMSVGKNVLPFRKRTTRFNLNGY